MPFGWVEATSVAQYTFELAAQAFQIKEGDFTNVYIDDLLCSGSKDKITEFLKVHGMHPNLKKCLWNLDSDTEIPYLGVLINLKKKTLDLEEDKRVQVLNKIELFIQKIKQGISFQAIEVEKLAGSLVFVSCAIEMNQKSLKVAQTSRLAQLLGARKDCNESKESFLNLLQDWQEAIMSRSKLYFAKKPTTFSSQESVYVTDASLYWGAVVKDDMSRMWRRSFGGTPWEDANINTKELKTIQLAAEISKSMNEDNVLILTDSVTAIAWIEAGSSKIAKLHMVDAKILEQILESSKDRRVKVKYVPTGLNIADAYSRRISQAERKISSICIQNIKKMLNIDEFDYDLMSQPGAEQAQRFFYWEHDWLNECTLVPDISSSSKFWIYPPEKIFLKAIKITLQKIRTGLICAICHKDNVPDLLLMTKSKRIVDVLNIDVTVVETVNGSPKLKEGTDLTCVIIHREKDLT